jgi:hypothetical protein
MTRFDSMALSKQVQTLQHDGNANRSLLLLGTASLAAAKVRHQALIMRRRRLGQSIFLSDWHPPVPSLASQPSVPLPSD